jgi:hypothetical protein
LFEISIKRIDYTENTKITFEYIGLNIIHGARKELRRVSASDVINKLNIIA